MKSPERVFLKRDVNVYVQQAGYCQKRNGLGSTVERIAAAQVMVDAA